MAFQAKTVVHVKRTIRLKVTQYLYDQWLFPALVFKSISFLDASQYFYVCSVLCQSCHHNEGVKEERQAHLALLCYL